MLRTHPIPVSYTAAYYRKHITLPFSEYQIIWKWAHAAMFVSGAPNYWPELNGVGILCHSSLSQVEVWNWGLKFQWTETLSQPMMSSLDIKFYGARSERVQMVDQSHLWSETVKLLPPFDIFSTQGLSSSSDYFLPGQLTTSVESMSQFFLPPLSISFSAARVRGPFRIKSCEASLWSTLLQWFPFSHSILFTKF